MSYRANGQSTGVCTVEFQRADDAGRAYTQYNNRLIDGSEYRPWCAATGSCWTLAEQLLVICSAFTSTLLFHTNRETTQGRSRG